MPALFDPAQTEAVKAWLVSELAPICDAEPDVLADYVIALLKHDASEADLAALLKEQLLDFLDDKTDPFVSKLIGAISSKAYVSAQDSAGHHAAGSTEKERLSLKRPAEDDSASVGAKASRIDSVVASESGFSSPKTRGEIRNGGAEPGSGGERSDRTVASRTQDMRAQQGQRRQKCRDFHEKGWCSRGENCRFEHSLDAIRGGLPFANRFHNGMAQHDLIPGQSFDSRFSTGNPKPGMPQSSTSASMPPPWAMLSSDSFQVGAPPNDSHMSARDSQSLASRLSERPQNPSMNWPSDSTSTSSLSSSEVPSRGSFPGRVRGRGGGGHGVFQNRSRSTTTLVIENVPSEHLDLVHINDYFRRFGVITNIQIDSPSSKALVSYSSPGEAKAAHESPEVIFGNRFVKVYFQKLDAASDRMQPPTPISNSTQAVQRPFNPGQNVYRAPGAFVQQQTTLHSQGASDEQASQRRRAMQTQKQAQDELDRLMTEQKQLLLKVGSKSIAVDDRKAGMRKLKDLEPTIKEATEKVKKAVAALAGMPTLPASSRLSGPTQRQEQKDKATKEQLDRELEAHSKSSVPSSQNDELRAKLESLKAEAAAMGIKNAQSESINRQRGGWSGSRPMRLDNRSTRLDVTDLPAATDIQSVKQWLQSIGDVVQFEEAGSTETGFRVTFKHRESGEQAMRTASNAPNIGKVTLSWAPAFVSPEGRTGQAAGDGQRPHDSQTDVQASKATGSEDTKGQGDDWKR